MFSQKKATFIIKLLLPLLLAFFSIFVLAVKLPGSKMITTSVESLEESKGTVMRFTEAVMLSSLAISALPDDFATPLASTLSDMNKYFIMILIAILIERLVVIEGVKISLLFIIPFACLLYFLATCSKRNVIKNFANKILILGLAVVFVIPCSIHFTKVVCADYMTYVESTINDTAKVSEIITNNESKNSDATIFEKLSSAFKTAIDGVKNLMEYVKGIVKKCVNAIAIMIVTTCILPLLMMMFFAWFLNKLFDINIDSTKIVMVNQKGQPISNEKYTLVEDHHE